MEPQPNPQAGTNSYTATDGTNLDPTAVTLAKSIRQVESNGNYEAIGDRGQSHGAYQFNGDNFQEWAKKYNLNPEDMSPTNQDKVAYYRIEDMLKQGSAPSEVAARWNGARMVNGKYVAINPSYVDKVKNAYGQVLAQGSGFNPHPYSGAGAIPLSSSPDQAPEQPNGLGQELLGRTNDAGQAIQEGLQGKINPLSSALQVGGALGGAVGDVTNSALELIPGVKQVESLLGQGFGKLAQTPAGQSVVKYIQDVSKAHPELAGNIGAAFNILTAIPILKGLGAIKDIGADAFSRSLKGIAEKGLAKDLTEPLSRTIAGREALQNIPDITSIWIKEGAIPDFATEGGITRYDTEGAIKKMSESISKVDDKLQAELEKANVPQIANRMPLEEVRVQAVQTAKEELKDPAGVNAMFDRIKEKYGDYPTLQQLNEAKRTVSKQISEAAFGDPNVTTNKAVRSALQKSVEEGAKKLGLKDVHAINQEMRKLIMAQDMLSNIGGKTVKVRGMLHTASKMAAKTLPLGGFISDKLDSVSSQRIRAGIVRRASQGSLKNTIKKSAPRIKGLLQSSLAQKATQ